MVAQTAGSLRILHFVNGHPRAQNDLLATHCGLGPRHHEMIPPWMMRRVEAEITLADLILIPSGIRAGAVHVPRRRQQQARASPLRGRLDGFRLRVGTGPHSPLRVLFVGQISPSKGSPPARSDHETRRNKARTDLYGAMVSPEVWRERRKRCAGMDLLVPSPSWPAAMRRSDVMVLPWIEDSSGLVVTEALRDRATRSTTASTGASPGCITNGVNRYVLEAPRPPDSCRRPLAGRPAASSRRAAARRLPAVA